MKKVRARNDYEKEVNKLRIWARAYYLIDDPIVTDEEYDLLYHKVMKYEQANNIINIQSPTHFVGWPEEQDL